MINFFLPAFNFYLISDAKTEKGELLAISDTRNIRDAVTYKLFAAVQQAAA